MEATSSSVYNLRRNQKLRQRDSRSEFSRQLALSRITGDRVTSVDAFVLSGLDADYSSMEFSTSLRGGLSSLGSTQAATVNAATLLGAWQDTA
jgi:hypothetical protein